MNIGVHDVDGHRFPNLALMKISAYHKSRGDTVDFVKSGGIYDITYKSKIFTFTKEKEMQYSTVKTLSGGTGYGDYSTTLPDTIEHMCPDYGLYRFDKAVGFTTRGCPNRCGWCVVPKKEGQIVPHADIAEFWTGQRDVILLDNNILASDHGLAQLEWSTDKCRVDCNQGMDARIIAESPYIQDLLGRVKWTRFIRMACDHRNQMDPVKKAVEGIRKRSGKIHRFFVYTLLTDDYEDSLSRIEFLKDMHGVDPFAQPYRDFTKEYCPPQWQRNMARWVNMKPIFRKMSFQEYMGTIADRFDFLA